MDNLINTHFFGPSYSFLRFPLTSHIPFYFEKKKTNNFTISFYWVLVTRNHLYNKKNSTNSLVKGRLTNLYVRSLGSREVVVTRNTPWLFIKSRWTVCTTVRHYVYVLIILPLCRLKLILLRNKNNKFCNNVLRW